MLVQSAGSDTAYDVIVVGAGPAGIIFTSEYSRLRPDRTIAHIEAGGFSTDRQCAVEAGGACSACPDGCGTIQGYGGCLHPG